MAARLPRGRTLRPDEWERRHQAVSWLLVLHAPGLAIYAVLRGNSAVVAALSGLLPALAALVATRPEVGRQVRSAAGAAGLMLCSAIVVHLSQGAVEAHFHFFVLVWVIALYEDWVPFGFGVVFVLLEHGVVGTVWPETVYNHASAQQHPWWFAVVHAVYFASACVCCVLHWQMGERGRASRQVLLDQLAHRSRHDELTGLVNRAALLDDADSLLRSGEAGGDGVAVFVLDLDRFKDVNDTLGHHHGDELLRHISRRLRQEVRPVDTIARLGGDEFAVVVPGVDAGSSLEMARWLQDALREDRPILAGVTVHVDVSVGIAVTEPVTEPDMRTTDTPESGGVLMSRLLRQAEVAMHSAKSERSGPVVYDAEQDGVTRARLSLLVDLRQAVHSDQLVLYYQPKVRLAEGRVIGAEALVRWIHPELGMVPPMDFIPLAEATDLIVPLTHRLIRDAIAQIRDWSLAGADVPVAVNVSPRSVIEGDLPEVIRAALEHFSVPAAMLRLEITESTLVTDPDRARRVLRSLREIGVGISLDDFGTGYSSLSYLKHLPVDELKVDKSFVMGMLEEAEDAVLVQATIDLGHSLGMSVLAEGVEDAATAAELHKLGCDAVQGYFYTRPLPAEGFSSWLADNQVDATTPA